MFVSITPNLIVRDIAASLAFYRDVLGFTATMSVPDAAPFVFVGLERDGVPVFLNDVTSAGHELPSMGMLPPGGTCTMFFIVTEVDALHAAVAPHARIGLKVTLKIAFAVITKKKDQSENTNSSSKRE